MKINSSNDVSEIRLEHNGLDLRFVNILDCNNMFDGVDLEQITVEFKDLMEVDSLINILTRFKEVAENHIGRYKEV